MKKICTFALVAVLTLGLMTGCRRNNPMDTTVPSTAAPTTQPTTAPTTRPTTAPTTAPTTEPIIDDMLPGDEDTVPPTNGAADGTVDPTAGANEDSQTKSRSMPRY